MNMDQAKIVAVIRAYREGLERLFGNQLVSVTLYGSFARGEGREDSDIDILCVLRSPFDYGDAIRKSSELTAELSLAHDVVLSRVFVSEEDMKTSNLPFFRNIRREGVPT
ncbi:MAG: nucleotidyltransferase domain-containing protein [Candidatus Tectomicrobia bacterium]|nr:nucleotidyltransferase domain-containing protein [Candidatus Tectomicrobia bacterium]